MTAADTPAPDRGQRSLFVILWVQMQNAFNDNFVKFVLIGLVMNVAAQSKLGEQIEFILAAMIPLPFILLAPVAGFVSDRFSKRSVINACLLGQLILFATILGAIFLKNVPLAIVGYFLLAVQSTVFSPAKQGILKELVGTQKLGFANGLASMLTMAGILLGMWVAGIWFDGRLAALNEVSMANPNGWEAASLPIIAATLGCLLALALGFLLLKTPAHPEVPFRSSVFYQHFIDLKRLWQKDDIRKCALFVTFYWLVVNFLGILFFQFAEVLNPDATAAGRLSATAAMLWWVGGGLIVGSLIVSFLSRQAYHLSYCVPGGLAMALGMVGLCVFPISSPLWNASLAFIGLSSGFFIVPLNAHLQALASDHERARILSALNVMTAGSGIIAIGISNVMATSGLPPFLHLTPFILATVIVSLLLPRKLRQSSASSL